MNETLLLTEFQLLRVQIDGVRREFNEHFLKQRGHEVSPTPSAQLAMIEENQRAMTFKKEGDPVLTADMFNRMQSISDEHELIVDMTPVLENIFSDFAVVNS
jgi:hypothetical protein